MQRRQQPGQLVPQRQQIRRKLEPDPSHPRFFITESGIGYRFEARESDGVTPD